MAKRRRKGPTGSTKGSVGRGARKGSKPAQPDEAPELWDRSSRPAGRELLERKGDPFLWLTGALYIELGLIQETELLPPEKSSDDSDGIPRGPAPLFVRRLYTLEKRYRASAKIDAARAGICADEDERRRLKVLAARAKALAVTLKGALRFCLLELYDSGEEEDIIIASDWTIRITSDEVDGDDD